MLKITVAESSGTKVILRVEGQVTQDWVAVLDKECRRYLEMQVGLTLDLRDVRAVDLAGAQMIRRLCREQVSLMNVSALLCDHLGHEQEVTMIARGSERGGEMRDACQRNE